MCPRQLPVPTPLPTSSRLLLAGRPSRWRRSAFQTAHLSNAITKVGGRNRLDAIRIARDTGWL